MNSYRIFALTAIAVALVIGASGLSEAQQPIRIGATMAETGNLATQGGPASNGYRLCQKPSIPTSLRRSKGVRQVLTNSQKRTRRWTS